MISLLQLPVRFLVQFRLLPVVLQLWYHFTCVTALQERRCTNTAVSDNSTGRGTRASKLSGAECRLHMFILTYQLLTQLLTH